MTFDLLRILASKRAFRQALATRNIVEKLAMLDELRARTLTLRAAREAAHGSSLLREDPETYRLDTKSNPS